MSASVLAKVPRSWILLAAIGLIALNMRGPFVAVAPVVGPMQQELGFSPVELGFLTGIPVLCFALAAPLASLAGRKLGAEVAITLTLLGVLLGVIVRSAGNGAVVMLGTVILGVAITIGNIAVPLIIRRDFAPARQGTAMGIYTAALNIGSFLTAMVTAPLAELFGWRLALAASGLFAVAALVVWVLAFGRRAFRPEPVPGPEPARAGIRPASRWITVGLTAGFAGQAFSYYGVTAWLPSILADELGMTAAQAGAGSSLFQILAIVGGLGVPLAARFASTTAVGLTLGLLWLTVPAGPAAGAGAVVAVVLVRRRRPGRRHHADLHRHHPAGPGPGLGGPDVRRRPGGGLLLRCPGADPAGLRQRRHRVLDRAAADGARLGGAVHPRDRALAAPGAEGALSRRRRTAGAARTAEVTVKAHVHAEHGP